MTSSAVQSLLIWLVELFANVAFDFVLGANFDVFRHFVDQE